MPRRTQRSLVSALEGLGLRFRSVTVATEGEYQVTDADWNVKDVPHLNQIHHLVNNVNAVTDDDVESTVTLQRVLGVPLPLVLVHYDSGPDRQTYYFTLLMYTVVGEVTFERLSATRTRVISTYFVGASRFWIHGFPIVAWLLKRNYRVLMSEDLPMRDRRGELRAQGYSFVGDEAPRRFPDSLNIERDNVVPPPPGTLPAPTDPPIDLDGIGETPVPWGATDHLGLQVHRTGDHLVVQRRMCPHEGACLDAVERDGDMAVCPWHGRRLPPVATLRLDGSSGEVRTPHHVLQVAGGALRIELRSTAEADQA